MKLRVPSKPRQILFLLAFILCGVWQGYGQQAAPAVIKFRTGAPPQQGTITGVSAIGVGLEISAGNGVTIPFASIESVQMAAPPQVVQAQKAFAAKDYQGALRLIQGVVARYKGLPTDWAQLATGMVGDLYVTLNDPAKAEAAYVEFQKWYPGQGGLQAQVGMARIAAMKKDFTSAKQKLEPIAEQALKERNVSATNGIAYGQAFYVLGQVKESEGNLEGALEDYLRTVTIFYHDPAAVSAAQDRANAIRKEHKITVP